MSETTEKTKVNFSHGLQNVDYKSNETTEKLGPKIDNFLASEVVKKLGIKISFDCTTQRIKLGSKFGFGFAISKFDENFRADMGSNEFRYKTDELHRAITEMVRKFDLRTTVDYQKGGGMFIYNVWVK